VKCPARIAAAGWTIAPTIAKCNVRRESIRLFSSLAQESTVRGSMKRGSCAVSLRVEEWRTGIRRPGHGCASAVGTSGRRTGPLAGCGVDQRVERLLGDGVCRRCPAYLTGPMPLDAVHATTADSFGGIIAPTCSRTHSDSW
jgi:hypothetical protein